MSTRVDVGLVGGRRTAALVGRCGGVDWLCLPRLDPGLAEGVPARRG